MPQVKLISEEGQSWRSRNRFSHEGNNNENEYNSIVSISKYVLGRFWKNKAKSQNGK